MSRGDLTPREQAKLEDFARDLNRPSQDAGPSVPKDVSAEGDLTTNLKKNRADKSKVLSPLTPSVADDREVVVKQRPGQANDDLDVDMFARGDVGKVVDELKQQKAVEQQRLLAKKAGLPFVRLLGYPVSPDVLAIVPTDVAERHGVVAYLRAGNKVRLGVINPQDKDARRVIDMLRQNTPYDYLVSVIDQDSYRYVRKLYQDLPKQVAAAGDVSISSKDKRTFGKDIKTLGDLASRIKEVPTTKIVDTLLTGAVKIGASDVHIEPEEQGTRIRYRLDGVLQDVVMLPSDITNAILSRLKFLAKLKLDVNKLPQDGRFTIKEEADGARREIDIRVATIPSEYGESVTMRLLDRRSVSLSVDSLGLTGHALERVLAATKRPQGMVLECGPTGSGKTTTLYALLNGLNDPGKKVITLEDPVEYRLPGIVQSQVEPEKHYDFSNGFKSVLRLDPDIVMVGEIRDNETAEMAIQASLTGHIVLSTLHTNDAPTALPRLIDLGVRPFLLTNAINVIIAQRLVRKVCPHCAKERRPDAVELAEVKQRLAAVPADAADSVPPERDWLFLEGGGCEQCHGTGFRGRIGIFEVLVPDEALQKLALAKASIHDLRQAATKSGMMAMEQDGLIKAVTGVTTVDEVWRVARDI